MDSLTRTISSLEEMEKEAQLFVAELPAEKTGATLVTLSGELGAGKTTFTQCIAKALGIEDTVNSPTYVIEKIYGISPDPAKAESARNRFTRLVHIDAYRLQSSGDLTALGFGEVMSHTGTLILLEWPEHVVGIAEEASVKILLEVISGSTNGTNSTRQITYA